MTTILDGLKKEDLPAVPFGYRILVKQVKKYEEEVKERGIIVALGDEAKRQQSSVNVGQVLAMGPECFDKNKEPWYQVGDFIKFVPHNGHQFKHGDHFYHIMNDEDPLAFVPKEALDNE